MADTYKKPGGSAGSKGVDFQIDLLSVVLLNALKNIKDWKLSTENKMAGKFDDVVLELSDGSAILLQAKHKENKKVTLNQLLSTNSKKSKSDFSLPKYYFSYLNQKTKFPVKFIIICTNTQAGKDILRFLNRNSVCGDSILHYEDGASFFTVNDDILPDLVKNAKDYHDKNLKREDVDGNVIAETKMKEFLKRLQIYLDYPSENDLKRVHENILSGLKSFGNLYQNTEHRDLCQKVKDWFQQPKGEYLTEHRAKAMFCEIRSEWYRLLLKKYNVFFRNNHINFTNSNKRIFHIVTEGGYLLHLLEVYRSLQRNETKILYAGPDDVQEQVIEAFELPLYTYLIIVSPKFSEEFAIKQICDKLKDTLHKRKYKKLIFVTESNNKLAERIKSTVNDYHTSYYLPTLEDLSEDTQQMLLRKKSIVFQGVDVSIEELFPEHITDDIKKSINSETIEKLVKGDKIKVGVSITDLKDDASMYYLNRKFTRTDNKKKGVEAISEEDISGAGKTTVHKKLATIIKAKNPQLWVVRIELNDYSTILRDSLKYGKSISMPDLLKMNDWEEIIFPLTKSVLLLDGIDEISPLYTNLIMDLLFQSKKAENLIKIFVTTRSHMERKLETQLKVRSFTLVPLTEQNQIDFFVYYWTRASKLKSESRSKCERYAATLISRVSSWTGNWRGDLKFSSSPLHIRMLAEVFLTNNGEKEWEGCKEYLNADEEEPKLSIKMNIAKLYEMFIDKKKEIFMDKGNPIGNARANEALEDQFEECLAYHKSLALETILDEKEYSLFSCYQQNDRSKQIKVLHMGIVQNVQILDNKPCFVHRTFAEYFVAKCLQDKLQLPNKDAEFQKFLINKIFFNKELCVLRCFLDNFASNYHKKNGTHPWSFDVFENYVTLFDAIKESNLIHRLAEEGNTEIIRFILNCIEFKNLKGKQATLNLVNARDNEDRTPLHRAVHSCHLDTVKVLVERGANVYSDTMDKGTMLHYAARRGDCRIVAFLVNFIRNIDATNSKGSTALHYAAKRNSIEATKCLVKYGANIHIANKEGYTALQFAVRSTSVDIVKYLIEEGANIDFVNIHGRTAVHIAAGKPNFDIVKILVEYKADINIADNEGYTPLHFSTHRACLDIVKFLVEHNANVNVTTKNSYTALHFAAKLDSFDIVEFLVQHHVDVQIVNNEGYTALHYATRNNNFEMVKFLVKHGVNIHVADNAGHTALHFAGKRGNNDIVKFLVDNGARINNPNDKGYTALHFATQKASLDIVEFLIQRGANINIITNEGSTALHFAAKTESYDIFEILVKNGADIQIANNAGYTPLHFAAQNTRFNVVNVLVECSADISLRTREGYTALHLAANEGSFDIFEFLVKKGADIHIADSRGYTALHFAAKSSNFNIVELLVEHGVNIHVGDEEGYTALHFAAQNGNSHIIHLLVKKCYADINIRTREGYTALHFAAQKGFLNVVQFLVENQGNIDIRTNEGYTALHFAVKRGIRGIVDFLLQRGADTNAINNEGYAALHYAAERGNFDVFILLMKHDLMKINIANMKGYTALHFAAGRGYHNIIEFLVDNGACTNITNNEGCTALQVAAETYNSAIVEFLEKYRKDG